jgi:ribonuclease BN (tRNA processing enzyme)
VVVHEFATGPVPEDEQEPALFNKRAKIWRSRLPPDQLNPRGYIDGDLSLFMPTAGRATQKKGRHSRGGVLSMDPRAGFKPMKLPGPGDPTRTGVPLHELTWTIAADEACTVTAMALPGDVPCLGYVVQEADRAGRLSIERCTALNIKPGKSYGLLKDGISIANEDGVMVEPADVVSPDKPGRKVAIVLNTKDASAAARLAQGADVVVHDAVAAEEDGVEGRASAADAGRLAAAVGARHLLLANMDGGLVEERRQAWVQQLVQQAAQQYGGGVSAAREFFSLYMERHEGAGEPLPQESGAGGAGVQEEEAVAVGA